MRPFTAVLLLAACLHLACAQGSGGRASTDPVVQFDSVAIATAATAVTYARAIDQIWPGFFYPPTFALYRRDTAVFLYTSGSPPAGFQLVRHTQLPTVLRGRLYVYQGGWPGLRGGVLPLDPQAPRLTMAVEIRARPVSQLEFLLHESFHGWQFRHFQNSFDPNIPQSLPGFLKLPQDLQHRLGAERRLLVTALRALTDDEIRRQAQAYLAARKARFESGDPLAELIEQRQERLEGTAEYVGLGGSVAANDSPTHSIRAVIVARVLDDDRWTGRSVDARAQLRYRVYITGAGMAFLLDVLKCSGWRDHVAAGEYLDSELAGCL